VISGGVDDSCGAPDQGLHIVVHFAEKKLFFAFWGDDLIGVTVLQPKVWYFVSFVYDQLSGSKLIYLNGALESTQTNSGHLINNGCSIYLGAHRSGNDGAWQGQISRATYFSGAMTPQQIASQMGVSTPPISYPKCSCRAVEKTFWVPPGKFLC